MVDISILTPSYNYANFLRAAVFSVLDQDADVEHIVADGGSSDETVEFLKGCPPSVRWLSEPDRGQSDALNRALSLATGDVVGWLNADDFYLPGALKFVVEFFAANPSVHVLHGDHFFVDAGGAIQSLNAGYNFPDAVLKWRGCVIPSTATFIRRSALEESPWDVELRVVMDWDLFLRLKSAGLKFTHSSQVLAAFRLHPDQVTHGLANRATREHQIVRDRWGAAPRMAPSARIAGDILHRACKMASGAWRAQNRARSVHGVPLLQSDGRYSQEAFQIARMREQLR